MLGANSPCKKVRRRGRVIDRRVASRGGHFNEIAEQSREALHFRGIARKRNGIASNRDARGKRPLHLTQRTQSEGPTICSIPPFGQRKRDFAFRRSRMGSLLMKAPLTCICRTTSLYQKHIEALVKGAPQNKGGWENDVVRNKHSVRFRRNQIARDSAFHWGFSRSIKRFRKRRQKDATRLSRNART